MYKTFLFLSYKDKSTFVLEVLRCLPQTLVAVKNILYLEESINVLKEIPLLVKYVFNLVMLGTRHKDIPLLVLTMVPV